MKVSLPDKPAVVEQPDSLRHVVRRLVLLICALLGAVVVTASLLGGCSLTRRLTGDSKPATPAAPGTSAATAAVPAVASTDPAAAAETGPKENSEGLPPKLVELVREAYAPDPDRPGTEIGPRNHYYETFRGAAAAFSRLAQHSIWMAMTASGCRASAIWLP